MFAYMFRVMNMGGRRIVVDINFTDYLIVDMSISKVLTRFGFEFNIFVSEDISGRLPDELFPSFIFDDLGTKLYVNDDLAITIEDNVVLFEIQAIVPVDNFFLYCLYFSGRESNLAVVLCDINGNHDFRGALSLFGGIRCHASLEIARLMMSGELCWLNR